MKNALQLLLLSLALLGPYLLRSTRPYLEPYPAVLFPAGAGKMQSGDVELVFRRTELAAVDKQGEVHPIDPHEFFTPIPIRYWPYIARRRFGVDPLMAGPRLEKSIGTWSIAFDPIPGDSKGRRAEVAQWMKERLASLGREDDHAVRVTWVEVAVSRETGDLIRREVKETFDVLLR